MCYVEALERYKNKETVQVHRVLSVGVAQSLSYDMFRSFI